MYARRGRRVLERSTGPEGKARAGEHNGGRRGKRGPLHHAVMMRPIVPQLTASLRGPTSLDHAERDTPPHWTQDLITGSMSPLWVLIVRDLPRSGRATQHISCVREHPVRRVHGLLVDLARLTALAIAPTWTRGVGPRQRSYGL
jgi:hypothetical protein